MQANKIKKVKQIKKLKIKKELCQTYIENLLDKKRYYRHIINIE